MSKKVNKTFKLSRVPRRITINLETVDLVAEGFSRKRAQKWVKKAYRVRHQKDGQFSPEQVSSALEKGFFPNELSVLEIVKPDYNGLITSKEYEFLGSLNGKTGLKLSNRLNTYKRLVHSRKHMVKHFYKVVFRRNKRTVEAFGGNKDLCTFTDVIETLEKKGALRLRRVRGTTSSLIEYRDGCYFFDGVTETKESLIQKLSNYPFSYVVTADVKEHPAFAGATLRLNVICDPEAEPWISNAEVLYSLKEEKEKHFPAFDLEESEEEVESSAVVTERFGNYHAPVDLTCGAIGDAIRVTDGEVVTLNENPNTGLKLEKVLPGYEAVMDMAKEVCQQVPRLRFFGLEFAISTEGCVLVRLINHPKYPVTIPLEESASNYLLSLVELKKAEFSDKEVRSQRRSEYIKWKLRQRRLRKEAGQKMRLGDKIKKYRIYATALNLVSQGFVNREAKKWAKETYRLKHNQEKYSKAEVKRALKKGFMPAQLQRLETADMLYDELISAKDYAYLCPINGGYSKWITDRITINAIFKPYRSVMPKCYYQIYKRDAETAIIPLFDFEAGRSFDDIINLVKEKGSLRVRVSHGNKSKLLAYVNGTLYYGTQRVTREKLIEMLSAYQSTLVVTENVLPSAEFNGARLRLTVFNEQGDNPTIGDAIMRYYAEDVDDDYILSETDGVAAFEEDANEEETVEEDSNEEDNDEDQELDIAEFRASVDPKSGRISRDVVLLNGSRAVKDTNPSNGLPLPEVVPYWDEIVATVDSFCRFAPQLEYFGMDIIISDDGFKIMKMTNHPEYPSRIPFSAETSAYLKRKFRQKKEAYGKLSTRVQRALKKMKLMIRSKYAKTFFPKGLKPYLSIRIFQDLKKDFLTNRDTSLKQKVWAAKHGFISYRIPQYGITEENHKNYISDFEYKWLRHINNKYRVWMEDKITVKYICSEYNSCFPEYYYHISLKNGSNRIIPMMDCPKELGNSFEDIVKLVHEKGALALKPDEGSHGDGFYKFSYEDGKYFLNHEEATLADVQRILDDVNNQYLVTEYINMHHEIKRIYDGAVNTIRMIVFKKDGVNPVIGNAYMRFGSKRTGAVDNMGAGGMFAKIDIDTGRFYDAKIIEANEIKPCLHHPDTGVMIDGYLPNWEKVKADVINVAKNIPQLEYFGFDLALTEDGLKFPEINRFPDYPAIEKYTPETIDYLLYKLEQRKKKYGYDVSRGNTLVKLPKR